MLRSLIIRKFLENRILKPCRLRRDFTLRRVFPYTLYWLARALAHTETHTMPPFCSLYALSQKSTQMFIKLWYSVDIITDSEWPVVLFAWNMYGIIFYYCPYSIKFHSGSNCLRIYKYTYDQSGTACNRFLDTVLKNKGNWIKNINFLKA